MSLTLRQICLVAEKLQPVIDDLVAVLGVEICHVDPQVEVFGLENALVAVDTNFIEVVAPITENTAAGRYLDRRGGNGGYMVIIQADNAEIQAACRERAADLNIRVAFETPHDNGNYLQFHPTDTGGSFLEIDWDLNNNPIGNWAPAGGTGWENHIRTDVISALKGVEIQSTDPENLAERWRRITGIELHKNAADCPELRLNNAVIRFIQADDGRGEGLGGIDIETSDPKKLLQEAEDRGLKISNTQVMICGVRFNLV